MQQVFILVTAVFLFLDISSVSAQIIKGVAKFPNPGQGIPLHYITGLTVLVMSGYIVLLNYFDLLPVKSLNSGRSQQNKISSTVELILSMDPFTCPQKFLCELEAKKKGNPSKMLNIQEELFIILGRLTVGTMQKDDSLLSVANAAGEISSCGVKYRNCKLTLLNNNSFTKIKIQN